MENCSFVAPIIAAAVGLLHISLSRLNGRQRPSGVVVASLRHASMASVADCVCVCVYVRGSSSVPDWTSDNLENSIFPIDSW